MEELLTAQGPGAGMAPGPVLFVRAAIQKADLAPGFAFISRDASYSLRNESMNRQQARGQILQVTGALREGWGRAINDHTMQIRGERERRLGRLQVRAGALRVILFSRQPGRKPMAQI
jgi:uncharacterized protein YjbJ (UPF0337 family)